MVRLCGELDLHTAGQLRQVLRDLTSNGRRDILLDLRELHFIDSAGLGVLVGGLRRTRGTGGSLALAAPHPRIMTVLDVGGLSGVFEMRAAPVWEFDDP